MASEGNLRNKRKEPDSPSILRAGASKRSHRSPEDVAWNQKFFELMLYKAKFGHLHVRASDKEHKHLHKWINQQRKEYQLFRSPSGSMILNEDRVQVLESVHFVFGTRGDEGWFLQYQNLKKYKEKHGHLLVPRDCEFPGLGNWVVTQRMQHAQLLEGSPTQLTPMRRGLLDEIGFVWQVRVRPSWESRMKELREYQRATGHTKVPQHYAENPALGKWVAKQRQQYKFLLLGKKSYLTPDRVEQLEALGFVWRLKGQAVEKADSDV